MSDENGSNGCPLIRGVIPSRDEDDLLYDGSYDFESRIGVERCVLSGICRHAGTSVDCFSPLVLLEGLCLLYECTMDDGTLVFSVCTGCEVEVRFTGSSAMRLGPDGEKVVYESADLFVGDVLRVLRSH